MKFAEDGSLLVTKPVKREHISVFHFINELDFPVGKKLLVSGLRGEETGRTIKLGFNKLAHFGCLGGYEEDQLNNFIDHLVSLGFLETEVKKQKFTVYVLTKKALAEQEERSLELTPDSIPQAGDMPQTPVFPSITPSPITEQDREMFTQLDFFLKGFTEEQKKAVIDTSNRQLCIAGAGSGKTRVLTHKIVFLVKYAGVDAKNILAITFTRKARKEMQERLEQLEVRGVRVETFNSFAEKELQKHGEMLYGQQKQMASNQEFVTLVVQSLTEIGLDLSTFLEHYFLPRERKGREERQLLFSFLYDFRAILDAYVFSGKDDAAFMARAGGSKLTERITAQNLVKLVQLVSRRLEEKGLRTYSDQLIDVNKLYDSQPDLVSSFPWVLVDEYQDVNEEQVRLLGHICAQHLFVVGDPRQSIYAWRGANPNTIFDFITDSTTILELTTNFRSSTAVVDYANKIIPGSIPLESFSKEEGCVELKQYKSDDDEARSLITMIGALDVPRNEIFILSRTNKGLDMVAQLCSQSGIPYLLRTDEKKLEGVDVGEHQITLSTVHAIKGLEAQVVFVIGANTSNYPCRAKDHRYVDLLGSKQDYNQYEEERRIFYVACTRAKQALFISYHGGASPFLGLKQEKGSDHMDAQRKALKRWRFLEAKERGVPAYRIFSDKVLEQLLDMQPHSTDELYGISGLGRVKIEEFGHDMISVLQRN